MVNKHLSQQLTRFTIFKLSEFVPHEVYSAQWSGDTITALSLERRRKLVELTAASGSAENVAVALRGSQCSLTGAPLAAAAAAGHLHVCEWLQHRHSGCLQSTEDHANAALPAAAAAGQLRTLHWLHSQGCPWSDHAPTAAARAGQLPALLLLLRLYPHDAALGVRQQQLLEAAAAGCSLRQLQALAGALSMPARGGSWLPQLLLVLESEVGAQCRLPASVGGNSAPAASASASASTPIYSTAAAVAASTAAEAAGSAAAAEGPDELGSPLRAFLGPDGLLRVLSAALASNTADWRDKAGWLGAVAGCRCRSSGRTSSGSGGGSWIHGAATGAAADSLAAGSAGSAVAAEGGPGAQVGRSTGRQAASQQAGRLAAVLAQSVLPDAMAAERLRWARRELGLPPGRDAVEQAAGHGREQLLRALLLEEEEEEGEGRLQPSREAVWAALRRGQRRCLEVLLGSGPALGWGSGSAALQPGDLLGAVMSGDPGFVEWVWQRLQQARQGEPQAHAQPQSEQQEPQGAHGPRLEPAGQDNAEQARSAAVAVAGAGRAPGATATAVGMGLSQEELREAVLLAAGAGETAPALLGWLRAPERAAPWHPRVYAAAAAAGSVPTLQWLQQHGAPVGPHGDAYVAAAANHDYAVLNCLRDTLRYPWASAACSDGSGGAGHGGGSGGGDSGEAFSAAVREEGVGLAELRWMRAAGCPVVWNAALLAARLWRPGSEVEHWVMAQVEEEERSGGQAGLG
ncbi:hypothetical protein HYH02_012796 [Chlamydomonas schloesseri]|uniref:Ankyrin repeat domain-containing protein n=1 Tax=Chlamydomonas schloesseri TaxID=2026947 RepID=A0A835W0W0_9CHLO|nr:hypothetical protein HYH02_012796 [Chlamydomonas schloesseri]|eukprot:KAG2433093.1 hypothetical protein HYH02_012796 [Chlamydomonas schloesseri]